MQLKQFILSGAGSFLLVFASASYAADVPAEATVDPTPEVAANPPADVAATPAAEAASNPQPQQVVTEPPANTGMTSTPAEQKVSMEKTAMAPPVVNDPGKVYLIRENPFYWQHIDKSIEHARAAEIAGNMGQAAELLEHAKMSLMQAREAQRAGNVGGLNEGIANLRKALSLPTRLTQSATPASPSLAQGVDPQMENRHQEELTGIPREESAVREATNFVREARKNLSQAAGTKYVEIQPQKATASN